MAGLAAPKLFDLSGRTIVISGGGRGIGLTIAQAVLESGAHVVALDLLPEPVPDQWSVAEETARAAGLSLTYRRLDITDPAATQSVFRAVFAEAPRRAPVRGLVVTAGIQYAKSALEYSPESFRKVVDVNVTGNFLSAQAFAREWVKHYPPAEGRAPPGMEPETRMAGRGGASIVMTASMSGHIANYGLECVAYNSSKAAVHQMCRNLAMEWGKYGIRVNTLSPGYIMTAMTAALLTDNPSYKEDWMRGSLLGRLSTMDEFRGEPVVEPRLTPLIHHRSCPLHVKRGQLVYDGRRLVRGRRAHRHLEELLRPSVQSETVQYTHAVPPRPCDTRPADISNTKTRTTVAVCEILSYPFIRSPRHPPPPRSLQLSVARLFALPAAQPLPWSS